MSMHIILTRVRELLHPLTPFAEVNQSIECETSRSLRPKNSTTEPQLVGQTLSAAKFWWLMLLYSGKRFNLCCNGTFLLSTVKVIHVFPIFLENRLQRFRLFSKKLFSFILTWQESFARILASTVVTAAFNEHKMIRKASFAVGCQLVTGRGDTGMGAVKSCTHLLRRNSCLSGLFQAARCTASKPDQSCRPTHKPLRQTAGEDSAELPGCGCGCRVPPQIFPSLPGACLTEDDHSG